MTVLDGDVIGNHGNSDLARLWAAIASWLEDSGVPVFPDVPQNGDTTPRAMWPDDRWKVFLETARRASAPIIYVHHVVFNEEELESLLGDLDTEEGERNGNEEKEVVRGALQPHLGKVCGISLAFSAGSVLHVWQQTAPWWVEALDRTEPYGPDRFESRFARVGRFTEELESRAEEEGWIRAVAELPRFYEASNLRSKREVVRGFLSEHAPKIEDGGLGSETGIAMLRLEQILTRSAQELFVSEVQPRLEDEAIEKVPEFYAELARIHSHWVTSTVKVRENLARRFLRVRYSFPMPAVVDMLARYKPGADEDHLLPGRLL